MRWLLNVTAENRNSSGGAGTRDSDQWSAGTVGGGPGDGQRHRLGGRAAVHERLLLADAHGAVLVVRVLEPDDQQVAAAADVVRADRTADAARRRRRRAARRPTPCCRPRTSGAVRRERRRREDGVAVAAEPGGRRRRREERPVPHGRQRLTRTGRRRCIEGGRDRVTWAASRTAVARSGSPRSAREISTDTVAQAGPATTPRSRSVGDLGRRQPEVVGEDLVGVLPEPGRRARVVRSISPNASGEPATRTVPTPGWSTSRNIGLASSTRRPRRAAG